MCERTRVIETASMEMDKKKRNLLWENAKPAIKNAISAFYDTGSPAECLKRYWNATVDDTPPPSIPSRKRRKKIPDDDETEVDEEMGNRLYDDPVLWIKPWNGVFACYKESQKKIVENNGRAVGRFLETIRQHIRYPDVIRTTETTGGTAVTPAVTQREVRVVVSNGEVERLKKENELLSYKLQLAVCEIQLMANRVEELTKTCVVYRDKLVKIAGVLVEGTTTTPP